MKSPVVKAVKKAAEKVAEAVKEIAQSVKPLLGGDPFYRDDRRARERPLRPGECRNPINQPLVDAIDAERDAQRGGGWIPRRGDWLR